MLTLAKGMLMDQAAAEDVVHDVFVGFVGSIKEFRLRGSLKGYLAVCVANRARDLIRTGKRRNAMENSTGSTDSDTHEPERYAMKREDIALLRQALKQIPYEQREAVLLHLKAGLTFRKIAEHTSVSISTVHGRYRYGLNKLRSLLTNSQPHLKE